jgi:hypothetical protein
MPQDNWAGYESLVNMVQELLRAENQLARQMRDPAVKYQWLSSADASSIIAVCRKSVVKLIDTW